jgi:hypothetical protein
MERVYLLLRNNQQTGPFTIGELLQQQLKPSDMIWIEGKTNAWTYLNELELAPFVKKTEVIQPIISVETKDEIERKAEELRQRILASAPKTHFPQYTTEIESYASTYKLSPGDEIEFVDIRKERKAKNNTILGELLLTCFVIGLFMVGIYKGKSFLGVKNKVQNSVATELNSHDQHTAQKNKPAAQSTIALVDTVKQADSALALQKARQKFGMNKKSVVDTASLHSSQAVINADKPEEKTETTATNLPNEESALKKEGLLKKEIAPAVPELKRANETAKTVNEPEKEEKKGFLKGLFKKKNKDNKTDKPENKEG